MVRSLRFRGGRTWTRVVLASVATALLLLAAGALITGVATHRANADYPPKGSVVTEDGNRVHVVDGGTGPAVVMIHGNPGFAYEFEPLAQLLESSYRVLAVDRPGHGASTRSAASDVGPLEQVRLLRAALDSLGVQRPTVLVGHSWGGGLALVWALEYPQEVSGLVLVGPRAFPRDDTDLLYSLVRSPVLGDVLRHTVLLPLSRPMVRDGVTAAYGPEAPQRAHIEAAVAVWTRPQQLAASVWDTRNLNLALETYAPRYGGLRIPVEILVGDHDSQRAEAERLVSALANQTMSKLRYRHRSGEGLEMPCLRRSAVASRSLARVRTRGFAW